MKGEGLSLTDNTKELLAGSGFPIQHVCSRGDSPASPSAGSCARESAPAASQRISESFPDGVRRVSLGGAVRSGWGSTFESPTTFVPCLADGCEGGLKEQEFHPDGALKSSLLLICPGVRPAVHALAQSAPLALAPILGKTLLEHWLDYLADAGVRRVCLLASDRPEQVCAWLGDGVRWELKVDVAAEVRELAIAEARAKYASNESSGEPGVLVMDFLPGAPERPLFDSYASWFSALNHWMPRAAAAPDRIGVRELRAGIWVGLHTRISDDAELRAPCWIGEHVVVGPRAIVGPEVIVEADTVLASDAEVAHSIVGPETYVGEFTELKHSLAQGSTLINWQTGSCTQVPDAFLLSPLGQRAATAQAHPWLGRILGVRLVKRIAFGNRL